jgi:hypothetical protein
MPIKEPPSSWPFNPDPSHDAPVVIDLTKLPDDPGKRADVYYALRVLRDNGLIEWVER